MSTVNEEVVVEIPAFKKIAVNGLRSKQPVVVCGARSTFYTCLGLSSSRVRQFVVRVAERLHRFHNLRTMVVSFPV